MFDQWKQRFQQHQYQKLCQKLQLPPQLVQDLPALAAQTQQSHIAIQQLQNTMQQTLSRLQQDDLTTISLLERVTKLERSASSQGSSNIHLNMLMKTTYSQSGEDAILAYLFAVLGIPFAKCSYLDLGANRPKEMSNTYFFYEQGATGTLVEANPALIPALQKERSGDRILNRCIAAKSGEIIPFHVMNVDGLSTPEDVTALLADNPDLKLLETVNVETISVNDLLEQMHPAPLLVNIDIEGMEMEILHSIDFSKYRPMVLILEMIPYSKKLPIGQKNQEIMTFLQEKGYTEYAFTGINSIFIDKNQVK
ncbi:MAG: FkbM family methyltransferase [Oscillospiraceae bacterium]|nr:FkbM family methyltransferase [Oscillospiraceae bacterium]